MVRRHADQRRIGGLGTVELDRPGDVAGQVVVGQLNGFGPRGGTRREQHHPDVVGVGELSGRFGGAGGGDELVRADDLLACAHDDVEVLSVGDHERLRQAVDELAQTVGAQPIVERCEGCARARRGEQQQGQHRATQPDVGHMRGACRGDDTRTAVGQLAQFG